MTPGFLATSQVVVVDRGHDWLDYLSAWSQLGAAVLGLVALVVAVGSVIQARGAAREAARTAVAAERTADTAREELEMLKAEQAKRPLLSIESIDLFPYEGQPTRRVLQIGMKNGGEQDADGAVINVLAPKGSRIVKCYNSRGEHARPLALLDTVEADESGHAVEWVYVAGSVDLQRRISFIDYYRIAFPGPGVHPFRVKLAIPSRKPSSQRAPSRSVSPLDQSS